MRAPCIVHLHPLTRYALHTRLQTRSYDPASDSIFFVGGRNTGAPSTMAGGKMGAKTVYAGCATLLSVDTNVPLPVKVRSCGCRLCGCCLASRATGSLSSQQ